MRVPAAAFVIAVSLLIHIGLMMNPFLMKHNLSVFHRLHVEAVIDRAKQQHVEQISSNITSFSLVVYGTLQPEYRFAE